VDAFRFGRSVKALRHRRGWRQLDLAERSGLSRSVVGRIELGQVERIAFGDLEAAARALDGQLELLFRWRGELLDRLIDEEHAAVVDELVRPYREAGWEVAVEASFSIYGERGSIDVFAWHPSVEVVAVNEVKATVPEAGNTVMGVDRTARLAPDIARERGWTCRGVSRFLVVRESATARRRVAEHSETFRAAFPTSGRESLAWIRHPTARPVSGLVFMPDSRHAGSRRRAAVRKRIRLSRPRAHLRADAGSALKRPPDEH
jgi:transcriptional regulator with XRE-family HTH domain